MAVNRTGGLYFDGIDDYMQTTDDTIFDVGAELTVSAWIKPSMNYGNKGIVVHDNSVYKYLLYLTGNTKTVSFYVRTESGVKYATKGNLDIINKWVLLTGVYDMNANKQVKLYLNGVLASAVTGYNEEILEGDEGIIVGTWSVGYFKGIIDDVRIYNRAFTAEEISRMYNENADIRDGLVLHLPMNEGTGNTCYDTTRYSNHGTIYGARWVVNRI